MIDESALLDLHIDVLFRRDANDRLTIVNETDGDRAPLLYLARGRSSFRISFRDDVSEDSARECTEIAGRLPLWDGGPPPPTVYDELTSALAAETPATEVSSGPAFRFDRRMQIGRDVSVDAIDEAFAHVLERFFPHTRSILAERQPVTCVVVDGAAVSACYSARRGSDACEAGVATEESYRGRGYGAAVVAAWRNAVEAEGRVPLYSTSWHNGASLSIARKLELVPYADTLSIS